MIYARVIRALATAGEESDHLEDVDCQQIAESLNHEFERLGIQIDAEEVCKKRSVLEIAEVITERIAA